MGLWHRAISRAAASLRGADPRKVEPQLALAGIFNPGNRPPPDAIALQQIDATNPTIYALLQRLSEDCCSVPLQLVQDKQGGEDDEFEVVAEHDALTPWTKRPNELQTVREFSQQVYADLIWMGNCFIYTDAKTIGQTPRNLLRLHPSQVTPEPPDPPNGRILSHYRWRTQDGRTQDYPVEQILHFKTRSPDSIYRGIGVSERLRDWLQLEREAMQWQYRRFYNDMPVDMIFKTKTSLRDPDLRKRVFDYLDQKFNGRRSGGRRWAVLEDGEWDVTPLPRAVEKEIQYLETLKFIRATYAMTCGVTPSKLSDFSDSFRANAEEQGREYWEDQIMAWHALFLDVLNNKYLRRYWPHEKTLRFQYDYSKVRALATSDETKTDLVTKQTEAGLRTPNEARRVLGLEQWVGEEADTLYYHGQELGKEPEPVLDADGKPQPRDAGAEAGTGGKVARLRIVKAVGDDDDTLASSGGIIDPSQILDGASERSRLRQLVQRDILAMYREAGNRQLEIAGLPVAFNVNSPEVIAQAARQVIGLSDGVNATTEDMVRRVLAESLAAGDSIKGMRERLQDAYKARRKAWQLDRVARTEVHQAQEAGGHAAAQQAGLEQKRWVTARDSRVRGLSPHDQADHAGMEGQVVAMSDRFTDPVSGAQLRYPGDRDGAKSGADTINCRCTWVADFSHLKSADILVAELDHAWDVKSTERERWELGLRRRLHSYLQKQEDRVLERFDAIVAETLRARGVEVSVAGK